MTDLDCFDQYERIEMLIEEGLGYITKISVIESVLDGYLLVYSGPLGSKHIAHYIPSLTPTNEQISEAIESIRFKYLFS